jgi:ribosome-binding factor A
MSKRLARVQKLARTVLGEAIQDLKDPRIGFATVTAVRITPDLRHAKVFVSVLGDEDERAATMAGLRSARSHLRGVLGQEVRFKYLPELDFELDTSPEEAVRLEGIINKLHHDEEEE